MRAPPWSRARSEAPSARRPRHWRRICPLDISRSIPIAPRMAGSDIRGATVAVLIEAAPKKVFAAALEWPGWVRAGRDEETALEALAAYAPRFVPIAMAAGMPLPEDGATLSFEVTERVDGNATTTFGAPDGRGPSDFRPTDAAEAARLAALVAAAWDAFDRVVAAAPAELRKGPRGGGRDRDAVHAHVVMAEHGYSRIIGVRLAEPDPADAATVAAVRAAILDVLRSPSDGSPLAGKRWPARYAARRIAWHVLDHAWEIEDRSIST